MYFIHAHIHICTCMCLYTCIYIYIHTHTCTQVCIHKLAYVIAFQSSFSIVLQYLCVRAYLDVYVCITFVYVHIYMCVHAHNMHTVTERRPHKEHAHTLNKYAFSSVSDAMSVHCWSLGRVPNPEAPSTLTSRTIITP
jgi:hypothetical protein